MILLVGSSENLGVSSPHLTNDDLEFLYQKQKTEAKTKNGHGQHNGQHPDNTRTT